MKVIVEDVELRGYEVKTSSATDTEYAILYFEEMTGKANNVLCRDVDLISENFQKGLTCNLICTLEISKFTKFELIGFQGVGEQPTSK